jgi:hypothetical protein
MFTSDKGPSNTRPLRKPNKLHTIRAKQHKSKLALFLPPQQSIYMVLILSFLFFFEGNGGHHENSVIASSTGCAPVARWIERRPGNMEGIKSGCTWWWWLFCRVTLCYCCTGCAGVSLSFSWLWHVFCCVSWRVVGSRRCPWDDMAQHSCKIVQLNYAL